MISRLKGLLFYLTIFGSVFFFGIFIILFSRAIGKPRLIFGFLPHYFSIVFLIFGIRVKINGKENLDRKKSYLILSNHQSFLDIPIILKNFKSISFLAKIEISKWPFFGFALRQIDCIFVDRQDAKSRSSIGHQMHAKMKKNVSFCVFPEGTREIKGIPLPFRKGIFKIAIESELEILPLTINNSWEILPKNSFAMKSGVIECTIHPSISVNQGIETIELCKKVEKTITSTLGG